MSGPIATLTEIQPSASAREDFVRTPFVEHRFVLPDSVRREIKTLPPPWGWQGLSEALYYRSYSREKKDKTQESWPDTTVRFIEGVMSIRKDHYLKRRLPWDEGYWSDYAAQMAVAAARFEWSPPGRGLWAMGTEYAYERGAACLTNCAYVDLDSGKNLAHALGWGMDMLMCGAGVGFGVSNKHVKAWKPQGEPIVYEVPDTREGWVESYELLILSYLNGTRPIEFRYHRIRPEGAPLKGIGGYASGPKPLMQIHEWAREAFERYIRGDFGATRLKADLANFLGVCVSMGGIRRSSEILLGSIHDEEFLTLKDYSIHPERSDWGWASNNTVLLEKHEDFLAIPRIAPGIRLNGEPGVANLVTIKKFGRFGRDSADKATGLNPCVCGDTKIRTRDGDIPIVDLVGRTIDVWNGVEWSPVTPRITGHDQPMVKVTLSNGRSLVCTKGHIWRVLNVDDGGFFFEDIIPAACLHVGDILAPYRTGPDEGPQFASVTSVEEAGVEETVYCFTEEKNHTGTFDGIVTGQCGEICLETFETCIVNNLYPSRCYTIEKLVEAAKFATFYNSTVALLPTHRPETNAVVSRNRRIGVSIAGLADWLTATSDERVTRDLRDIYRVVREENVRLAHEAGVPASNRVTTVKPDGSVAKLPGVSEGVHSHKFPFAIRRMSVKKEHPVVAVLKAAGYPCEPTATQPDLELTFEFPISAPNGSRTVKEQTIWEQLSIAVMMQREWSDNSVSITGEFNPETEGEDVVRALARNIPMLKSFSVLPRDTKFYKQMPYEEITKEEFERRKAHVKPLNWVGFHGDGEDQKFCEGGFCRTKS